MSNSQVWLQRKDESARAFRAFAIYRDLGADRSLVKVREKLGRKSGYDRQLQEWSSQHQWGERVAAYDAHLDERATEAFMNSLVARRVKILKDEVRHADALMSKFDEVLERVKLHETTRKSRKKGEDGQEVDIVMVEVNIEGLRELTQWRSELAKFSRLAVGMPDRIAQQQHTGKDGGPVEVQWTEPLDEDDDIGVGADELPSTD